MLPLVCNDAVAILFMFDLSRKSTLNSIKEWYRQARGFNKVRLSRKSSARSSRLLSARLQGAVVDLTNPSERTDCYSLSGWHQV